MRKYLKPALEIEAFDVEDIITASDTDIPTRPPQGSENTDGEIIGATTPIDVVNLN